MTTFRLASAIQIREIFAQWQNDTPHPTTELFYHNGFQLLIAVVLSAQTTDVAVNKATQRFFASIDSPVKMVAWGEENLREAIRSLGLYRTKARHVLQLSANLIDRHGGEVPDSLSALMALPGVGLKTASVVMNTLFGAPLIAVDTHVFRVAHRVGLVNAKTADAAAKLLPQRIPPEYQPDAHHWLILHGRAVCHARNPDCDQCAIHRHCPKNGTELRRTQAGTRSLRD